MPNPETPDYQALYEAQLQKTKNAERRAAEAEAKLQRVREINDQLQVSISQMSSSAENIKKHTEEARLG